MLEPERRALYARCDARLAGMWDSALDEVRALVIRRLDPASPIMKAVGARELAAQLGGRLTPDEALASAQRETRRYAKRQMTWQRNQIPDWPRIDTLAEVEQLLER